jgi:filamin
LRIVFFLKFWYFLFAADIKMPSGKVDKPVIEDNRDGTVSIKYDPREEGLHELAVKYNGEHIQGSPYKFHVDNMTSGYVTAYGAGLTHGVSGEPSDFIISTKGAGAGGLSMAVEGPSKADVNETHSFIILIFLNPSFFSDHLS